MSFLPLDSPAWSGAPQLVATIGPASAELIDPLAAAGATAFRLNASHLDAPDLAVSLARIREACPNAPIVVDLQGAKMRIALVGPRAVVRGHVVRFRRSGDADVRVPHPEFFAQARPGDTISVDDGRVRFEVLAAGPDWLDGRALNDGQLASRKGVNVEQHPVRLDGLTERDLAACRETARFAGTALAFSFMTDGGEAEWLRAVAPSCRVIGKVERSEATANLAAISRQVDAVWICRGDLGAQLGAVGLARFVAGIEPRRSPVPILMAGQVLEHLTAHGGATRSEVCHLFDLHSRGFAGIVLSDETAIGRDPVHAVSTAAGLLASFRS